MNDIPRPRFDPTVNLGHVLSIISFIGMALAAYFAMKSDIDKLEGRMVTMEKTSSELASSVSRMTEVIVLAARQDERMRALEGRADRLERALVRTPIQ